MEPWAALRHHSPAVVPTLLENLFREVLQENLRKTFPQAMGMWKDILKGMKAVWAHN